jgi:glucokinase
MSQFVIGVDLGGTRIRAARLDEHLTILDRVETLTRADEGLEPTLQRIKYLIAQVVPDDPDQVAGIGISAPGPLNPETGVIVAPPNLPGWTNVPLGDILKDAFHTPVYVGNDANVAALAEVSLGAAQGYQHAIYITISTGIGSGIIANDRLLLGKQGLAAEFGHIVIWVDDHVGTLETEAAGPDMALQAANRITDGEPSIMRDMVAGKLNIIDGKIVGDAALQGDALALDIVTRSGRLIGMGIVNLLHLFNPEIIVIGGGVSTMGSILFDPMNEAIRQHAIAPDYWQDLIITAPALGEDVSIYGAAALVVTQGGVTDVSEVARQIRGN